MVALLAAIPAIIAALAATLPWLIAAWLLANPKELDSVAQEVASVFNQTIPPAIKSVGEATFTPLLEYTLIGSALAAVIAIGYRELERVSGPLGIGPPAPPGFSAAPSTSVQFGVQARGLSASVGSAAAGAGPQGAPLTRPPFERQGNIGQRMQGRRQSRQARQRRGR